MMEKHRIQTEVGVIECRSRIYLRQGVSSVARRALSKKDKIILLLLAGNTATHGAGYYPHFSHFGFLLAYASERDAYDYARHLIPFLALNGSEVAF
jgi:hypothetical protein